MKKIQIVMVEGYFRDPAQEDTKIYPMARARVKAWKGRRDFIAALELVEASPHVVKKAFKGASKCRICDAKNGSNEFVMRLAPNVTWRWPGGFMHYVVEHNVRPSLAFQQVITQVAAILTTD